MCKKTVRVVLHVQSPAAAEVSPSAKLAPNKKQLAMQAAFCLVRLRGLEPLPVAGMEPKSIVYTSFTTSAYSIVRPACAAVKIPAKPASPAHLPPCLYSNKPRPQFKKFVLLYHAQYPLSKLPPLCLRNYAGMFCFS